MIYSGPSNKPYILEVLYSPFRGRNESLFKNFGVGGGLAVDIGLSYVRCFFVYKTNHHDIY
jgi:hypothetical protein